MWVFLQGFLESEVSPSTVLLQLPGEVAMIILEKADVFVDHMKNVLFTLSRKVRSSLRISRDEEGRLKIRHWNSVDGAGALAAVPEESVFEVSGQIFFELL